MRHSSHRWLAGPFLALAVLAAGVAVHPLRAQSPGGLPQPAGTAPPPGAGSAPIPGIKPASGFTPGLPSGKSAASSLQKQGDLLRLHRNVPGDAKPILVEADEITTW